MSFAVRAFGFGETIELLQQLQTLWSGDTVYVVGPEVSYGIYQERGTSSIEARPYMRPAAERVQSDPERYLEQYGNAISGPITSEAKMVEVLAIAVQNEAKKIADQKGVRDTGALIASITYEEV